MAEIKQGKTRIYSVWFYDVWGNDEDGFEVNDRSCVEREIELPLHHTDEQLNEVLSEYFDMDVCAVDNSCDPDYSIEIVLKEDEGHPVGQLQFEEMR